MVKKLIPLFAILTLSILAISTGAFTSVTADRVAEINVAGDASALLAMAPYAGSNGSYAHYDNDGALYLDLSPLTSRGVNVDAQTRFDNVFTITNNGTQSVTVTLDKGIVPAGIIDFFDIEEGVTLGVGETYVVSLLVNSTGLKDSDAMLASFTINATAGTSGSQDGAQGGEESQDDGQEDDGNNGHGNDEDGSDESNPGNSTGNNGNHNGQN